MEPHTDTSTDGPPAELDAFAAVMRSVLRTRHDSPGDGPEALESWTRADGYVWQWTTDEGQWRVSAGGLGDPRPLLHGPGGIWRVTAGADEQGAGVVLVVLRAGGAIGAGLTCQGCGAGYLPPAAPAPHHATLTLHPGGAMVNGERFTVTAPAVDPPRAVLFRPTDEVPELPAGYVPVRTTSHEPDPAGMWEVLLPDGYHKHRYDPTRRCLVPYESTEGDPDPLSGSRETMLLLFEPGQDPTGPLFQVKQRVAA